MLAVYIVLCCDPKKLLYNMSCLTFGLLFSCCFLFLQLVRLDNLFAYLNVDSVLFSNYSTDDALVSCIAIMTLPLCQHRFILCLNLVLRPTELHPNYCITKLKFMVLFLFLVSPFFVAMIEVELDSQNEKQELLMSQH